MKQRTLISNQFSGSCFEGQTKKAISVDIGSSLRDYSFGWHPKKNTKEETRAYQMPSSRRKGEGEIKRDENSTLTTIQPLNVSKGTGMQLNECHLLLTPHAAHDACRLTHHIAAGGHQRRTGKGLRDVKLN